MHFSPLPTLTMSLLLGCTEKSLMPEGTSPGPAVSPEGRPWGLGMGALIVERAVQSRVRVMAIVLSSAALRSFARVGKYRAVMLEEWWRREPSSLFLEFSVIEIPVRLGILAAIFDGAGGAVEREYRLMRSSVAPVANVTLFVSSDRGDTAKQRIADACALKRNVSVKSNLVFSASGFDASCFPVTRSDGIVAAKPCKTRS